MAQSSVRLKVLGLCLLVLGLTAFVTSSAQAEAGANWKVNGTTLNSTLNPGLQAALENSTGSLLATILGISVKILCTAMTTTNTLGAGGAVNSGKERFSGCETYLNGKLSVPCLPKTAGVNDVIETNNLVGELALVGGVGEVKIKSAVAGTPIAVIESTEECPIGQKIKIEGTVILKDCEGKLGTEQVTHLGEADNVNGTLTASGQKATLDGSANFSLSGPHAGLKWSGVPA